MKCPVCGAVMSYDCDTMNGMVCESFEECTKGCGMYAEEFAYGASRSFIRGVEYMHGDPRTIEGNRLAWCEWFAIVQAREAWSNGDVYNE